MALILNIYILIYLCISAYIQIYIGTGFQESVFILVISAVFTFFTIRFFFKNKVFFNFKISIFLIVIFFILWAFSLFPPIYDDEFAYVATLPLLYCRQGILSSLENVGFFSYLYQSYESGLTVLECLNLGINTLRVFNIFIIIAIISIFIEKNNNKLHASLILLALPVLFTNGLILKNDILGAYFILSSCYFLFYKSQRFQIIGFASIINLLVLKPILILDAIPILICYYRLNNKITSIKYRQIFIILILITFQWILKNFNEFGQPFFPMINLVGFSLNNENITIDIYNDYKILIKETYFGLKNFSFNNGYLLDFIIKISEKFGYLYIIVLLYSLYNYKNTMSQLNIILIVNIYFFSLWELRYHMGVALISFLYINLKEINKLILALIIILSGINSFKILNTMYIQKSIYYYQFGLEAFKIKYMSMNENNKIIDFLNDKAKFQNQVNILADNSVFYYLDKNIKYFWFGPINLNEFNNIEYNSFKALLDSKSINYILYFDDIIE